MLKLFKKLFKKTNSKVEKVEENFEQVPKETGKSIFDYDANSVVHDPIENTVEVVTAEEVSEKPKAENKTKASKKFNMLDAENTNIVLSTYNTVAEAAKDLNTTSTKISSRLSGKTKSPFTLEDGRKVIFKRL